MSPTFYSLYPSPIGDLLLTSKGEGLTGLYTSEHRLFQSLKEQGQERDELFGDARQQLAEYFQGERCHFQLPLQAEGTSFQQKVWSLLRNIPFGETRSYLDLAKELGSPKSVRAVGAANGKNPLSIIVPCHRVVGSNGKLTGYAGGLAVKEWLLEHEGALEEKKS